jgi:hypothetical protein
MIEIRYRLVGTGWAECRVADVDKSVTVTASYLSDALASLADSVLAMLNGAKEARASFDEEPGEYRWVFNRRGDASDSPISLCILEFQDLWSNKPDEEGQLIFETLCPITELAAAVVKCLDEVKQTYGEAGYKEKWVEHDFPARTYAQLHAHLKTKRGTEPSA